MAKYRLIADVDDGFDVFYRVQKKVLSFWKNVSAIFYSLERAEKTFEYLTNPSGRVIKEVDSGKN